MYHVLFDDGDQDERVQRKHIQALSSDGAVATPEDADGEQLAEEAGVRLHLSSSNSTGYRGVNSKGGRFTASHKIDGKKMHVGSFGTAVEAAIAYAKHLQSLGAEDTSTRAQDAGENEEEVDDDDERTTLRQAASSSRRAANVEDDDDDGEDEDVDDRDDYGVTALQAAGALPKHVESPALGTPSGERLTEAEGLRLHLAEESGTRRRKNSSGYLGVHPHQGRFRTQHHMNGKTTNVGTFDTAVEAAVAYAKYLQSKGLDTRMQLDHGEDRVTEAEGLKLHIAEQARGNGVPNPTGYVGVYAKSNGRFEAKFQRAGGKIRKNKALGTFATAVEAAVAYAEHVQSLSAEAEDEYEDRLKAAAESGRLKAAAESGDGDKDRVAEVDYGVRLELSDNAAGYRGVYPASGRFQAKCRVKGKTPVRSIGYFDTAVEAAVAYTKHMQSLGLDKECGERVTEAEGLRLHLAEEKNRGGRQSTTGYLGVQETSSGRFLAAHQRDGKNMNLGTFDTAVEAAVAYAKHVQSLGIDNDYGQRVAEAEGLRLHFSEEGHRSGYKSTTGYLGVHESYNGRYLASVYRNGKRVNLGTFDTPVEAAVAYAKHAQLLGLDAPDADGPATKRRRLSPAKQEVSTDAGGGEQQMFEPDAEIVGIEASNASGVVAKAQGVRLHLSKQNATGYRSVYPHEGRFQTSHTMNGKHTYLGSFNTAVEAAVAYAKHVQSLNFNHEDGERVAEAEILPLHLADKKPRPKRVSRQTADREWDEAGLYRSKQNPSGYRGISQVPSGRYKAQHSLFGKLTSLGTFDTAVEAAVAYAKHMKSLGGTVEEDDEKQDEAGLYRSNQNPSGYRGIYQVPSGRYKAQHSLFGKKTSLGTFETAVEAAVAYAKHMKSLGATVDEDDGEDEEEDEEDEEDDDELSELEEVGRRPAPQMVC